MLLASRDSELPVRNARDAEFCTVTVLPVSCRVAALLVMLLVPLNVRVEDESTETTAPIIWHE